MTEILTRVWENLVGRLTGPMNFRFLIQPTVAALLAIRGGLADARRGQPAFLWSAITDPLGRRELLAQGWKDVAKVFTLAVVLDVIYQLIVHRTIFVLETLIVAVSLAIVPYVLVRGPAARLARWWTNRRG